MDSASSASSGAPPNQRKERGAIAAQACDRCRQRKQKCDETRPKCGVCQRLKLECNYREPQPTKKDKTLVELLDAVKRMELKVDRVDRTLQTGSRTSISTGFGPPQQSPTSQPSFNLDIDELAPFSPRSSQRPSPGILGRSPSSWRKHAAHKILTWPVIQQVLLQSSPSSMGALKTLERDGSAFLIGTQQGIPDLLLDDSMQQTPFVGMQSQATRSSGGARNIFPMLTRDLMQRLATAYFDTFNFLYPFMDRQNFISDTLTRVESEGFDGDIDSVIALLVFALGEVAIEGSQGEPIASYNGRASGLRGGSAMRPPGLAFFNEARKRIGFTLTTCSLENVQIFSLAALYYETCGRHVEFWRMAMSASSACHILIKDTPVDWNSARGDLVKRAYWHCVSVDSILHNELDLPPTGLANMEDQIAQLGNPTFNGTFCEADHRGNLSSHFEAHYMAHLDLRKTSSFLNRAIHNNSISDTPSSSDDLSGTSSLPVRQLATQLARWRATLPRALQWSDDDPTSFPPTNLGDFNQPLDPNLAPHPVHSGVPMFTTDFSSEPLNYPYAYDIQVAFLRTRFYHAKYILYRPFVYKALHSPELMSSDDAEAVAECLRACLNWPITLAPVSRRKRLIPFLFCWTQNFLGILIIIHLTWQNGMLKDIRARFCGPRFEAEIEQSVEMMLDWIRDLKGSDPIANWCWKVLQAVYGLEG